jgi:molecular chaperone HscB
MSEDYFQILGVKRRYHLAPDELERNFHERSKLYHPDRHAKADGATRMKNALATSQLNQAYRELKDPIRRAEYLLKLEGIDINDEASAKRVVEPEFLMEVMEERERLMDARLEGARDSVEKSAAYAQARVEKAMEAVDTIFDQYEGGDRSQLETAAHALIARRYFGRMLDEATEFLDGESAQSNGAEK